MWALSYFTPISLKVLQAIQIMGEDILGLMIFSMDKHLGRGRDSDEIIPFWINRIRAYMKLTQIGLGLTVYK